MNKISVIYHKNCPDGFSGAWTAWKKFGEKAEYLPIEKRDKFPGVEDKEVYIIDLSFTESILKEIKEKNKKVIVIDHHESVADFTEKIADEYVYSKEEAGSVLAWKYFFPKEPIPLLLKYVEDIDLWKLQLPYSKEIIKVGESIGFKDIERWNNFVKEIENEEKRNKKIELGKTILRYEDQIIENIAEFSYEVEFENMKVLAVNSIVFRSQLGHILAENKPPLGIIWKREKEGIKVSLRGDGSINVSKIAKKHGGGGHANAASFFIPKGKEVPWKDIS